MNNNFLDKRIETDYRERNPLNALNTTIKNLIKNTKSKFIDTKDCKLDGAGAKIIRRTHDI
jgi:hypothetical protein